MRKQETAYSQRVQKYLRDRGYYVVNYPGGSFGTSGTPDLLVCAKGRFIGIELKAKNGRLSKLQEVKGREIEEAGGLWIVSHVGPLQELGAIIDRHLLNTSNVIL